MSSVDNKKSENLLKVWKKQCIEAKIQKKEDKNFKFFTWKSFECEIW